MSEPAPLLPWYLRVRPERVLRFGLIAAGLTGVVNAIAITLIPSSAPSPAMHLIGAFAVGLLAAGLVLFVTLVYLGVLGVLASRDATRTYARIRQMDIDKP